MTTTLDRCRKCGAKIPDAQIHARKAQIQGQQGGGQVSDDPKLKQAVRAYLNDEGSYKALAERFGVSGTTLQRHVEKAKAKP